MTKLHTCYPKSASSKLGIDRDSRVISKLKPKIRIIHIYAPEIIKTDAANFRELVQRLTGKPEDESKSKTAPTKSKKAMMIMQEDEKEFLSLQNGTEVKNEHQIQEEDAMWRRPKSNEKFSDLFEGFSEFDGFMEVLSNKYYASS